MRLLLVVASLGLALASCGDRLACVQQLEAQLVASGAYVEASPSPVAHKAEGYAEGELGLVARGFVAEGDVALSVPMRHIVMPANCDQRFDEQGDAVMYLTRCLLTSSNPLFKLYLAALPQHTTNLYAYSDDEFAEFQGTALKDILELKREAMKELHANMTDLEVSFEELYAVYSKVVARSHTIPVKVETEPGVFDWKYLPALVPMVDMLNQGIQNTACFTPEKGDEFVCETLEEVLEGTELLVRYGSQQMDNIRSLVNYGLLDDDLWRTTPLSIPMPPEIALMSEAKLEIAAVFHKHIASFIKDRYMSLTAAQVPAVAHSSSIILGMERLACVPEEFVETLDKVEHVSFAQTLMSCNSSDWDHEKSADVIPHACHCGQDALINHFKTTLSGYPTTIEEDEAYLKQLQNQRTVAVGADGAAEAGPAPLSPSTVRRINAVRWRMQEKRILKQFEDVLVAAKIQL